MLGGAPASWNARPRHRLHQPDPGRAPGLGHRALFDAAPPARRSHSPKQRLSAKHLLVASAWSSAITRCVTSSTPRVYPLDVARAGAGRRGTKSSALGGRLSKPDGTWSRAPLSAPRTTCRASPTWVSTSSTYDPIHRSARPSVRQEQRADHGTRRPGRPTASSSPEGGFTT